LLIKKGRFPAWGYYQGLPIFPEEALFFFKAPEISANLLHFDGQDDGQKQLIIHPTFFFYTD